MIIYNYFEDHIKEYLKDIDFSEVQKLNPNFDLEIDNMFLIKEFVFS